MTALSNPRRTPSASRFSQAERSAISDQHMLNAAIRLIVERGTEKTTLKDVGELAGYSRGLAGYRFGSKSGLFVFVLKSIGEEWLQELKSVTKDIAGLDAICAATDAHYEFCVDAPEHVRAFYLLWFESIGPNSEFREVINTIHERRQLDVKKWVDKGILSGEFSTNVDANKVAGQFCTSIIGIVYQWLISPDDLSHIKTLYEDLKSTMRLLLHADVFQEHIN